MKFGIVGNNDGPLYLLKALQGTSFEPQFIGLQNRVSDDLKSSYKKEKNEITFFQGFNELKLLEKLEPLNLDLLINCFCNFRFNELLEQPFDVLNTHLSPLPKYRGRHPLQWALINGESEFGFSVHRMTEEFDAGEIYWQENVSITEGMSVHQLRSVLMKKLEEGFTGFLDDYENENLQPASNPDEQATYIPRRHPEDSRLTEWNDGKKIIRKVMALRSEDHPAYVNADSLQVKCYEASLGIKIDHDLRHPFIYELKANKFQAVCLDGQTVWMRCLPDRLKYLSLGQKLDKPTPN